MIDIGILLICICNFAIQVSNSRNVIFPLDDLDMVCMMCPKVSDWNVYNSIIPQCIYLLK